MSIWELSDSDILRTSADGYASGLYTKAEAVGGMIGALERTSDFRVLWAEVPDWAQSEIWTFLKGCDATTILYDFSSGKEGVIPSSLIELKDWLVQQFGWN